MKLKELIDSRELYQKYEDYDNFDDRKSSCANDYLQYHNILRKHLR